MFSPLNQAVARHKNAWRAELLYCPNRHLPTQGSWPLNYAPPAAIIASKECHLAPCNFWIATGLFCYSHKPLGNKG
jgi:hypothetical protein